LESGSLLAESEGKEARVQVWSKKVVVNHPLSPFKLVKGVLQIVRDPARITEAFKGPSKSVLIKSLENSRQLLDAIWAAIQESRSDTELDQEIPRDEQKLIEVLGRAIKTNTSDVIKVLKENRALLKDWLDRNRELVGIFLVDDVHVLISEIHTATLQEVDEATAVLRLVTEESVLKVEHGRSARSDVDQLVQTLTPMLTSSAHPEA
jgi:hypothetical protein